MDKTFSPSYSSSQKTNAEAVEFSRFCFRFHIPGLETALLKEYVVEQNVGCAESDSHLRTDKYSKEGYVRCNVNEMSQLVL